MTTPLPLPIVDSGIPILAAGFRGAFFLPGPIHEHAASLSRVFQHLWDMAPAGALKWQSIGAGADDWRPVNKGTLTKCTSQLEQGACKRRDLTSIDLRGGIDINAAPDWSISILGNPTDLEMPDELTLLEFSMPAQFHDEAPSEQAARDFMSIAAPLAFRYAYFSPALLWSPVLDKAALIRARSIASQFPGFDISANSATRSFIGKHVRGARWITLLDESFRDELGSPATLAQHSGNGLDIVPFRGGMALRAGTQPALNAGNTDEYRALCRMARLLQPVTLFEDMGLLRTEFVPDDDENFLSQWEHRLLNAHI